MCMVTHNASRLEQIYSTFLYSPVTLSHILSHDKWSSATTFSYFNTIHTQNAKLNEPSIDIVCVSFHPFLAGQVANATTICRWSDRWQTITLVWVPHVSYSEMGPICQLHLLPHLSRAGSREDDDGGRQLGFWRTLLLSPDMERGQPGGR